MIAAGPVASMTRLVTRTYADRADLPLRVAGVHRHVHATGEPDAEHGRDQLGLVRELHGDGSTCEIAELAGGGVRQ